MYSTIAGIDTKELDGAGYKQIIIKPQTGGDLTYAKGSLKTNYGLVGSSWKIENGKLILDVQIPANTNATIYFPTKKYTSVNDNGKAVNVSEEGTVTVGAGSYSFTMEL